MQEGKITPELCGWSGMHKVKNGKDFKKAMTAIALKLEKKMGKQVNQKLALDAFTALVRRTIKVSGFLGHNWDVSIDIKPVDEELKPEKGKSYQEAKKPVLKKVKYNSIIIIYNNTEYAIYMEQGTENMDGTPMVAPTEIEMYKVAEDLCKTLSLEQWDD